MIKGNISLNKLAKIIKEKQEGIASEIPNDITFCRYDEAREKINICENLHDVWLAAIKKELRSI